MGYTISLGHYIDLVAARTPILGADHIATTAQIPNGDIFATTADFGSS
jgi:hypothetical protein